MSHLPTIPQYLLESSICMIVFYSLYYTLFKKETFHNFNRFYLLATALLSVLIPFIGVDTAASMGENAHNIEPLIQYKAEAKQFVSSIERNQFYQVSFGDIIKGIYYVGLFLLGIKFLQAAFQLMENINKRNAKSSNIKNQILASGTPLYTHLYSSDEQDDDVDFTRATIKEKALKNIKLWHMLDVVIIELIVIINWFNPLVYLFRNNFFKTHTYIADRQMSKVESNLSEYAEKLAKPYKNKDYSSLFYEHMPLVNRVMMLTKKPSNNLAMMKPLLFIPVLLSLFTLFSFDYADNIPEEIKLSLRTIENGINESSEVVLLNLTHSKRNLEWEFKWGEHIYGTTAKDNDGNVSYDISKQISLFDLYESIERNPTYKTKGIYESMGFDIKITSNSDTVSNISVPVGDYVKLGERMKEEIIKHKTPFNIYFSNIGTEEGKRNGGFMVTVYQFMKSANTEEQGEERKIEATWGDLDLAGSDFGWIMSGNNGRMYGRWNQLRYSEKPFNINKKDFLDKIDDTFLLKVNNKEISTNESTSLTLMIRRPEIVKSDQAWNPVPSKVESSNGVSSVISYNKVYHGRSETMVNDEYDFKEILGNGSDYIKDVLSTVSDGDVITIAAIDTLDESDTGNHFFFNMTIKDTEAAYKAPFKVELPSTTDSYTNFQIYYSPEKDQTFVKVDTTSLANQNIVKAYRQSESYKLTHVPDFKTKKRVNDTKILPAGTLKIDPKMELNTGVLQMERLNEHYTLSDRMIRMDWGKMISIPGIGNFSRKEFKRSSRSNLLLSAGDNFMDISRFDMVIVSVGGKPLRIRTDNIKSDLCRRALTEINTSASIYFDNIIINDEDEYKYYPYQFVFNVE